MSKKVVHSETKPVVSEPFNSFIPGPRYETKNTHSDGSTATGCGKSKNESKRSANDKSSSSSSGSGCFLTSACVKTAGLADNCLELTVLRKFRDEYVRRLPDGEALLATYYADAPRIVSAIAGSSASETEYRAIFSAIQNCIHSIARGDNNGAFATYKSLFLRLSITYLKDSVSRLEPEAKREVAVDCV